jgi:signal transduction histidine kinase
VAANAFEEWRMNNEESANASRESVPATLYERQVLLAFMPPSQGQRRIALASVLVLSIVFVITAPFVNYPLPQFNAFIPAFETAVFICQIITASILLSEYTVSHSRELLVLASGYLFTALIVIPHVLTFPGALAPTGLLGAGSQSTAWFYLVWHFGIPLFVIGYALLKNVDRATAEYQGSTVGAIGSIVAIVIALICALTWVITVKESYLPRVIGADVTFLGRHVPGIVMLLLGTLALALLWRGRRSVLDLCLIVVMFAFLYEIARLGIGNYSRFSVGFYASRIFSLTTATAVLLVLLSETTTIYARLATAIIRQRRERERRQMTIDSITASIAHEVNQPLAAIVANGGAALRFLANATPNLDETRAAVTSIVSDAHRAGELIRSIRQMFKKGGQEKTSLDINMLIREVLVLEREEFRANQILVQTTLNDKLPDVKGNRIQLLQVILNLVVNAIDAMNSETNRPRVLLLRSAIAESDGVLVSIEDSGTGIDPKYIDLIFDSFFTTKSQGMGIGLFFCRSIIENHGGRIWATSGNGHGAVLHILLPAVTAGIDK